MNRTTWLLPLVACTVGLLPQADAQAASKKDALDPAGIARLASETGGAAVVSVNEATGAARFVRIKPGRRIGLLKQAARATTADAQQARSLDFFRAHGSIFGIVNPDAELRAVRSGTDAAGSAHLTYQQLYQGLPVFGGELRSHFDRSGQLVAINGTFVPQIAVSASPGRTADEAGRTAVARVEAALGRAGELSVASTTLLVFREGLAKGVAGPNHLAYEVEVGDGAGVREFVYIDAHNGKFIDQITGTPDGLNRRAYDGLGLPAPPPSYPSLPFWVEGQTFPTASAEANNMIQSSKETYDFYSKAFGRDSFDGAGATMDSIFNRGYQCPNASWNGTFISFCPGLTTDDVTGHEWTHAYTQYTHNLIYQWQPGALNESYSDIFGETIDRLNGRGGDTPDLTRAPSSCSTHGGTPPASLTITGGPAAGSYFARVSVNEPARPFTVGPTAMALASPAGACTPVTAAVSGKIAIIDWTLAADGVSNECGSGARATNAKNAGATAIIFVAPAAGLLNLGSIPTIASVEVTNADGATIKAGLPASATITLGVGTDTSVRWLIGEDDTAAGLSGPLRDMWNPRCFGNPGKVSDSFDYTCSTADGGGVHTNSGVPNHGYALAVDGGTYNGQTITGIGLTKAAHIYFRAMSVYQGPASGFADHADSLEQSCSDLTGVNLLGLTTGTPSGQVITAADCAQLAKAIAAVELRTPPVACNFHTLLAQNPPALCDSGKKPKSRFTDGFEHGNSSEARWSMSHDAAAPADFTPREWDVVSDLPDHRPGRGFFGADPDLGTCGPGGDESAVLHLVSPQIVIPASADAPRLAFDHWVSTEAGWDGGNVKISVNDGPWVLVKAADFVYNPYNTTLNTVAQGNTNPMAGEPAFSGSDGGDVGGTWGRSIVNLAPYASAGSKIRLRFDVGNDGCTGQFGWYLDDVQVYTCGK
jgi:Zn-dependent metalloprotease